MADQQNITKEILLDKKFLMNIHAHELLSAIKGVHVDDPAYISMWKNTPEISDYTFGGLYGTQFTSVEQYTSFNSAFDKALLKHNIDVKHKSSLLYLIGFIGEDYQAQSLERNRINRLKEYTRFILDLYANCLSHIESMEKNLEYEKIHDEGTTEYFFAKKTLLQSMPVDEIIEYRPNDNPGDLVQYLRVPLYQTELYVPPEMIFSVINEGTLKTFEGEQMHGIVVPPYLQSEVFKFTINYMLDEHRESNTDFFRALNHPEVTIRDLKTFYNKYKKHSINYSQSMLRVGKVISDYLLDNKLSKNKSTVAAFLFDYFSLFKVIPLKDKVEFPIEYSEISNFYNRNGITKDAIRYMMRDAVIVGGI